MTNHIDTCAAILSQAMRVTAQGKWHVWAEYSALVDWFTVRFREASEHEFEYWEDVTMSDDNADQQLAAIRTELDKLECGE
jgi:hypothetical protein